MSSIVLFLFYLLFFYNIFVYIASFLVNMWGWGIYYIHTHIIFFCRYIHIYKTSQIFDIKDTLNWEWFSFATSRDFPNRLRIVLISIENYYHYHLHSCEWFSLKQYNWEWFSLLLRMIITINANNSHYYCKWFSLVTDSLVFTNMINQVTQLRKLNNTSFLHVTG